MGKKSKKRKLKKNRWLIPGPVVSYGDRLMDKVTDILTNKGEPKQEEEPKQQTHWMHGARMNHFGGWVPPKHNITPTGK